MIVTELLEDLEAHAEWDLTDPAAPQWLSPSDRLADRDGRAPPVIDSDDLLENPHAVVHAWCDAVGIPFIAESLYWEDSKVTENPTWNKDEHGFHDSLKSSTGLMKQKREYPPLDSNEDMMRLYRASLPHYEALFEQRLRF